MGGTHRRPLARTVLDLVESSDRYVLIDIGARGGLEPIWQQVEDQILAIGFEPGASAELSDSENRRYLPVAVWERSEPLTLYVSRDPGKTSVFRPRMETLRAFPHPERFETVEEITLPEERVRSLDDVLRDNEIADVDFIKVDTQGSELQILKGATESLRSAVGLKTEVEFLELYDGQALFADIDTYARSAGFQLVDLLRVHWKLNGYTHFPGRGQLVFGDALYFREQGAFLAGLSQAEPDRARTKVLKFAATCLLYGVHDYAVTLLDAAQRQGTLDDQTHRELREAIAAHDRRRLPFRVPGVRRVARALRKVQAALDRGHERWGHSDRVLGNR